MIFFLNKTYYFFRQLLLDNKIRKYQFEEIVALKFASNTKIIDGFPLFVDAVSFANLTDVYAVAYPTKNTPIGVGYLNTDVRQFCNMTLAINQSGNISNFCISDFRSIKRDITFKCSGLKGVGARMRTIFAFVIFRLATMKEEYFTTTQASALNFRFGISNLRQACSRICATCSRTKASLSFLERFFTFFTCFHNYKCTKWTVECQ